MRQPQIAAQPLQLFPGPQFDLRKRVGTHQNSIKGYHEQLHQIVFLPLLADVDR